MEEVKLMTQGYCELGTPIPPLAGPPAPSPWNIRWAIPVKEMNALQVYDLTTKTDWDGIPRGRHAWGIYSLRYGGRGDWTLSFYFPRMMSEP